MYAAITYVDTGRRTYAPGEIIREEYEGAAWHLKVGAIREVEETSSGSDVEGPHPSASQTPSPIGEGFPKGKPDEDLPAAEPAAEEEFAEPEPPEIDVESAIIGPEPKPAKKSTRKGAKK